MYTSFRLSKIITLLTVITIISAVCFTSVLRQYSPAAFNIQPVKIAVIMYHGLIDDTSKQNKYFIDPKYFEEDLKYLNENGFQTIFASDLISHFEKNTPLPEKPVLLTFDDGYYNNYTFAYPLLKKYNCKAVISPIGYPADEAVKENKQNPVYSQCTWKQLKEMADSGFVEIQNHTYNLHHIDSGRNGAKNNTNENPDEYRKLLSDDLLKFNKRMFEETGKYPESVVFPFGARSKQTVETVKSLGFKAAFDCEEKVNLLSSQQDLFYIHRFLRPNNMSSKDFFGNIYKQSGE